MVNINLWISNNTVLNDLGQFFKIKSLCDGLPRFLKHVGAFHQIIQMIHLTKSIHSRF